MRITIFYILVALFTLKASAQKKTVIKGQIVDSVSNDPLSLATISIVDAESSALISYSVSDGKGNFVLSVTPNGRLINIIMTHIGYKPHKITSSYSDPNAIDLGQVHLQTVSLKEVSIEGYQPPIVVKKDTIEYNADAFKTRPNAILEDLLRKLPGVQINMDGSIAVNGRQVSKILIDGKQFFGEETRVATRNLDAGWIDKIQVYDDRDNDPDGKLTVNQLNKIVNLKLKSFVKKSVLGKIYAGGGTRDRYEIGGIASTFRDTLQLSAFGLSNNLNKTGLSNQDLGSIGGFDRSGSDQRNDGSFGGKNNQGIESASSAGLNANNDYGKKVKLNLMYFFGKTDMKLGMDRIIQEFLPQNEFNSTSRFDYRDINKKHNIGGVLEIKGNNGSKLRYEPRLSFARNDNYSNNNNFTADSLNNALYDSKYVKNSNTLRTGFSHSFSYYLKLKKEGSSLHIRHELGINTSGLENLQNSSLDSRSPIIPSASLNQCISDDSNTSSGRLSAEYNLPVSNKIVFEMLGGASVFNNTNELRTFSSESSPAGTGIFDPRLSGKGDRTEFTYELRPAFAYKINEKYSLRAGFSAQVQNVSMLINDDDFNRNTAFYNLFPFFRVNTPSISLSYSQRIVQPGLFDLLPAVRETSVLNRTIGNLGLIPKKIHSLSSDYYRYFNNKGISLNGYLGSDYTERNIVNNILIDDIGDKTINRINQGSGLSAYFGVTFRKEFKSSQNSQFASTTRVNGNQNRNNFILNHVIGRQLESGLTIAEDVSWIYRNSMQLVAGYKARKSVVDYKDVDYSGINVFEHAMKLAFSLNFFPTTGIEGDYTFNYNPQIPENFSNFSNVLNIYVTHRFKKLKNSELKLSVYDLLDQNISVFRVSQNNTTTSGSETVLNRYFLLTYRFNFSSKIKE